MLTRYPWLTFLLPFVVFMAVGSLEPKRPASGEAAAGWIGYESYPIVYAVKIGLTLAAMLVVLPGYRRFPFRLSPLALLVGAAGIVLWVGFCQLHWEEKIFAPLGAKWLVDLGVRSGYDPFKELRHCAAGWQWAFLGLRVFGLVAVVPVIEEFFLRGFLMRWPIAERWWEVPVGTLTGMALLLGTLYPVLSHPAEMFAAVAWFTLVTLLAWKTKNIWDCVAAHAVTNLLLGVYVVSSGEWRLL